MPISMRLYKALQFAIEAHENQYDLGGNPYIMHPIYVASCMDTEEEKGKKVMQNI